MDFRQTEDLTGPNATTISSAKACIKQLLDVSVRYVVFVAAITMGILATDRKFRGR